jgi:hypothetical protein
VAEFNKRNVIRLFSRRKFQSQKQSFLSTSAKQNECPVKIHKVL